MDSQLTLHVDNLAMFLEPSFTRHTVGYYSITSDSVFKGDDSEKASLVALKEEKKPTDGVSQYEVPGYIEQLNLDDGFESYNDKSDEPRQKELLRWLKKNPQECLDVDVVCSQKTLSKIFQAPYTEATATPWEVKVTRGPDGICYVEEDATWRVKYREMNSYAQKQYFRQRAFQNYMTIKKGAKPKNMPPINHSSAFLRVNKLNLDSGVVIYQSEIQCFDINYKAIDLRAIPDGQFDIPAPSTRLRWWSESHLAGNNAILCGYYDNEEAETTIHRLLSFDLKHMKPSRIHDTPFDEEVAIGSLCTFVQFVKDITADNSINSFVLRFEPGSKRMCVLDLSASQTFSVPRLDTQISATDETSSVEATPRDPGDLSEEEPTPNKSNGSPNGMPRLRKVNRQDSTAVPGLRRRNTMTTEMGEELATTKEAQNLDNDDDKYKKMSGRYRATEDMEDVNYQHLAIIFTCIAVVFIGIPWIADFFGHGTLY